MVELSTNSADPDQTPRFAASDLGLHCLPVTLLGVFDGLINPRLLKEASNQLCTPLGTLFTHLISTGKFPLSWKDENVSPIYKMTATYLTIITLYPYLVA